MSETNYALKLAESKNNNDNNKLSNEKMSKQNSEKERKNVATFSMDETLPPLPLPELHKTLQKYLESTRPFLTQLEYLKTEKLVRDFESGIGQKLHFHLSQKASAERNWLEQWWFDWAYLEWRMPIAPFINTSGYVAGRKFDKAEYKHLLSVNIDMQLATASFHAYFMNVYFELLRKELIPSQQSRGQFFSMDQFRRFYNTCRMPLKDKDRLDVHFKTEREGECPTHFVVVLRNRFYKVNAFHGGRLLNVSELHDQLKAIDRKCKTAGVGVGALTADHRNDWAENREYLMRLHTENAASLRLIETSLYVLALDDCFVDDIDEAVRYGLYRNPTNRFFDKSYTHIITKNGISTSNTEHSAYDGICSATVSNYIDEGIKKLNLKLDQVDSLEKRPDIGEPTELSFHYDTKIGGEIKKSIDIFEKFGKNLELRILMVPNTDKNTLKLYKINPDTFTQMCMQLAYYQVHSKPAPTYETATTRQFYHGRTETVRSCTQEALTWCQQMCNKDPSSRLNAGKLLDLFRKACAKHDQLMSEARNNMGCDRHLLGLQLTAKSLNIDLPEIYKDPSWTKSGGGGNFVISSSCLGYTNINGGCLPMCTNGYTMIYCISDYGLSFSIVRYKESTETDLEKICDSLKSAFLRVQTLFETTAKI